MTNLRDLEDRGGPRVVASFASSATLARQIVAGAQANLFLSASQQWMDAAEQAGKIKIGTRQDYLSNSLVLIAHGTPASDQGPSPTLSSSFPLLERLGRGRLAVADPRVVPAGVYAKQALTSLGFWGGSTTAWLRKECSRRTGAGRTGAAPSRIVYRAMRWQQPQAGLVLIVAKVDDTRSILYQLAERRWLRLEVLTLYDAFLSARPTFFRDRGFERSAIGAIVRDFWKG